MRGKRASWAWRVVLLATVVSMMAVPSFGSSTTANRFEKALPRLSQGALMKYFLRNPSQAPEGLGARLQSAVAGRDRALAASRGVRAPQPPHGDRMNFDIYGLPQNEESVDICKANTSYAISGTNDYRGLLNEDFNFTGWHFSINGGNTLNKEGLLPPISGLASSGDPVYRYAPGGCDTFAADLNFNVFDPFTPDSNGIGVYKSNPTTLLSAACDTSGEPFTTDPDCWPTRKLVSTNTPGHFLDKEWFDVGDTGDGMHVWVTWSDFDFTDPTVAFTAQAYASRCDIDLTSCTSPMLISGSDEDIQFSYPTIGPDGRTYLTWVEIRGELEGEPQTFILKMRVAEPGSTTFGPTRVIDTIENALPFGGLLQANSFRTATAPKNTVKIVNGQPRVFVTYDECGQRILDGTVCEFPKIWVAWSDDFGATWDQKVVSAGGVNYFPSAANDSTTGNILVSYFTARFNSPYFSENDIEVVVLSASTLDVVKRIRATTALTQPNDPEADPIFQTLFIGDYIEVSAHGGKAYVGYNMNSHREQLLFEGANVANQDNFVTVVDY